MNATYIAIGAVFIVLGVGALARAKKGDGAAGGTPLAATDKPASTKGTQVSGILFMVAGLLFMVTGAISGRAGD